jgi:nickel/cobalt exporter
MTELVQQGWLFLPSAVLLGALHGLEPGHSKTMMAAFIIAIRGTVWQAAVLALAATVSHTAIVWVLALLGLTYGAQWSAETTEPYLQLASGAIIAAVAAWVAWRTLVAQRAGTRQHDHDHHDHDHQEHHEHHQHAHHDHPHREHPQHEHPRHEHPHHEHGAEPDAHERAHAEALRRRLTGRTVTTGQVVLFGLTGGLLPCPAAITVLLLCLQLKEFWLGVALVLAFSIGLALTLLASGTLAAWGTHRAARRWPGLVALGRRLPYLSSAIIGVIGVYVAIQGWHALG